MTDVGLAASRAARAWLWKVLEETGKSPTALAEECGVATTTLTRVARSRLDEDPPHELSLATIAKVAATTGIAPPTDWTGGERLRGLREPDGTPYDAGAAPDHLKRVVASMIHGRNAAKVWIVRTRSLELAGLLPGDMIVVDLNAQPKPGDSVCAQVYDLKRAADTETIFRIFEPPFLVAATTKRAHWKPLLIDDDRIAIKGVITDCYRPRRDA